MRLSRDFALGFLAGILVFFLLSRLQTCSPEKRFSPSWPLRGRNCPFL